MSPIAVKETRHYQEIITIKTAAKAFHPITPQVRTSVQASGINTGLCHLFLRHTSASLVIQENADPDVLRDLETFFVNLIPENSRLYRHNAEGPDDMPAHIRSVLTHTSEVIPIHNGYLALGTWQGIYLWEHRHHSHTREVVVHLTGS